MDQLIPFPKLVFCRANPILAGGGSRGTGNVPIPSRAHSPALPSVAMAQLWLTPFRDVPQVLVPTCGPEITQAELLNCPPVMETWQNQKTLLKEELPSGTGQRALENAILLDALPGITKIKPELGLACSVFPSCILPLLSRAASLIHHIALLL